MHLRALVIIANADGAILGKSVSPEAFDRDRAAKIISKGRRRFDVRVYLLGH